MNSPILKISDVLDVSREAMDQAGVFNAYVGIDSQLHLDPALLRTTEVLEFKSAASTFEKYFDRVLSMVIAANDRPAIRSQGEKMLSLT